MAWLRRRLQEPRRAERHASCLCSSFMRPPTYSMPIGIAVIALAGVAATGCSGSGLRSGSRDGSAPDTAASLGGQAGTTASAGGAGGAASTTDTAGGAGSPGTGGSADAGADAKAVCPPVCAIDCQYGNVLDANGCPTCSCNPAPSQCPARKCAPCSYGYLKDANGCLTCTCLPDCDGDVCTIDCQYGYVMDGAGCPTCSCNPPPCPAIKCASCPYGYLKDASGCLTCTCLPDPSLPCQQLDASQCGNSTHCRWLMPSCGLFGATLTESGCYDQVDCTNTSDCLETGSTCVDRMVAPPGGPGGDWCGIMVRICL